MNQIWKYPLYVQDVQTVEMPDEADILTIQVQGDAPYIWAMVNPDAPLNPRKIRIYGTGHPVDPNLSAERYIGTFQLKNGSLVLHVFDITTD